MSGKATLDKKYLEQEYSLVEKYGINMPDRPRFLQQIQSVTKILACTQIDENIRGFVVFDCEKADPSMNYYPSMFALQMFLEDIKLRGAADYPDILVPDVSKETVNEFVAILYSIDQNDDDAWRKTDSQFHLEFPNVYKVLRADTMKRRYARYKVRITNAVEKIALDQLLRNEAIKKKLQEIENKFPKVGTLDALRTRAQVTAAVQETQSYINSTFFKEFMEKVNAQAPPGEDDED